MKKIYTVILILAALFMVQPVQAHLLWLNVNNYQPKVDETVQINIGWGHEFPNGKKITEDYLDKVYALDQSGKKIPLTRISVDQYEFTPKAAGAYRILADIHPGFITKTVEGYKMKPKKDLEGVLFCFQYDIRAKSVIVVNENKNGFDEPAGDLLEIIPLASPDRLKEGELFPLKVLFGGKPLSQVNVNVTCEGFDSSGTFADTAMTDDQGKAAVKISKKGNWMVNLIHNVPYPDPGECDDYKYNYSFTFKVK